MPIQQIAAPCSSAASLSAGPRRGFRAAALGLLLTAGVAAAQPAAAAGASVQDEAGPRPSPAAQSAPAPTLPPTATTPPPTVELRLDGDYFAKAGFDGSDADVQLARFDAGVAVTVQPKERLRLTVSAGSGLMLYDFDGIEAGLAGLNEGDDPLDEALAHRFGLNALYFQNAKLAWFGGASVTSTGATDADFGDTLSFNARLGLRYQLRPNLALGVGVSASTRLAEDGVFIFPLPIVDWQIADRWRLATADRGIALSFEATDALSLSLAVSFYREEIRLADDSPIPEGVLIDTRVPVTLGAEFRPSERFTVTAAVGVAVAGEIEWQDEDGDELDSTDLDASPVLSLGVRVRF